MTNITPQEAKAIMDTASDYRIVDVRRHDEYKEGHIPVAICLPLDEIANEAECELPDETQLLLIYCRSGVRSKQAAAQLEAMGYTNIKEFGGILDWPFDTENEN